MYDRRQSGLWVGTASPPAGSYAAEVAADSPICYLTLSETSGAFVDTQGGTTSFNNLNTRGATKARDNGAVSCQFNNSNSSYVEITPATTFDGTLDQTWEWWFRGDWTGSGFPILGGKDDATSAQISHLTRITGSNTSTVLIPGMKGLNVDYGPGPSSSFNSSAAVFNHVVVTVTSGGTPTWNAYWNSTNILTGSASGTRVNAGVIRIGASPDTFWTAPSIKISDFALYQSVLSPTRVAAHYAAR